MCAPTSDAAAARWPAPSPLISVAAASSASAPSTSVHAAQLMIASGAVSRTAARTASSLRDVEVGAREGDDVVSGGGGRDDIRAEHARGPRDEKAHGAHV